MSPAVTVMDVTEDLTKSLVGGVLGTEARRRRWLSTIFGDTWIWKRNQGGLVLKMREIS